MELPIYTVKISELKPHPRNYRVHPDDQIEHIQESIRQNGFYRNIVIAKDKTILAGHGVVQAASKMEIKEVPVIQLDIDPDSPAALKVLTGDNEISHLVESNDRALSELLKEINDFDPAGLLGTGYDEMMLANLAMVTRPASEIADFDEAAHWVGMPDYQEGEETIKLIISFRSMEDRAECLNILGLSISDNQKSTWWPEKDREDLASLRFE